LFDYVLTGPISGVSAGQCLVGFLNDLFHYARIDVHLSRGPTAAAFAAVVTLYFWWVNIKGILESSERTLRIMHVTTVIAIHADSVMGHETFCSTETRRIRTRPWEWTGGARPE